MVAPPARGVLARQSASLVARGALGFVGGFVRWFLFGSLDPGASWLGAYRAVQFWLVARVLTLSALLVSLVWAWLHPGLAAALLGALFVASAAYHALRLRARGLLFGVRAGAPPLPASFVRSPVWLATRALEALALALDRALRGDVAGARAALRDVEPEHLDEDERRVMVGVGALASLGEGERRAAAAAAIPAFPTGAEALDERLGPLCVENALCDPMRLSAMLDRWAHASPAWSASTDLARHHRLALLKVGRVEASAFPREEQRALAELARTLGDAPLGAALEAAPPTPPAAGYR